jgi:hypothetical protein
MKKLRIFSLALLSGIFFFTSCKDDNEAGTAEKLQQYWAVDSVAIKTTTVAGSATIVYNGTASDYYDFRTNDSLYYKLNTEDGTLPYSILSDSWLLVDGDSAKIVSLTSSKLQLYRKDATTATDYVETTAWLRR